MSRKLKLWNGRWPPYRGQSAYVAAYSRADAVSLINQLSGFQAVTDYELKVFWHGGLWGNSMDGIEPERGLWVQENRQEKPKRMGVVDGALCPEGDDGDRQAEAQQRLG